MPNEMFKEQETQKAQVHETCAKCRLPITPADRKGSFTAFLFSELRCKCGSSGILKESTSAGEAKTTTSDAINDTEWPDLAGAKPDLGERYEVLNLIGQGGMGAVWKVRDKAINKTLAVKVLRRELAKDRAAVKRFEQEAQAASRLTHPNLVALYGSGTAEDQSPYMIMDFLEGENLAEILAHEGKLPAGRALDIASQVCDALAHAHGKGVVHRDLKPSNIILTTTAEGHDIVKLVDFGIAKLMATVNEQTNNLTQTGDLFGSPLYMSPEQCQGENTDARTDIYALGCIMFEMLSGQAAFASENPIKTILSHINDLPDLSPLRRCNAPKGAVSVISTCLEKEPASRYKSMEAVKKDLNQLEQGKFPLIAFAGKIRRKLFKATYASVKFVAESNLYVGLIAIALGAVVVYKTIAISGDHLQSGAKEVKSGAQSIATFADPLPSGLRYHQFASSPDRKSLSILDQAAGLTFTLYKVPKPSNPTEEKLTELFTGGSYKQVGTLPIGGQFMPYGYRKPEADQSSDSNTADDDDTAGQDFSHLIGRLPLKNQTGTIILQVDAEPGKKIDMAAVAHYLAAIKKF